MTLADFLTIIAILVGPIVAIMGTRFLDEQKEKRQRKHEIFKSLMITRHGSYTLLWLHVESLNKIDLEFNIKNRKEKAVILAWKAYRDFLSNPYPIETGAHWEEKRALMLIDVLYEMAQVLKYDFDKTHIKNEGYAPKGHAHLETETSLIRKYLLEVLQGNKGIPLYEWGKSGNSENSVQNNIQDFNKDQ